MATGNSRKPRLAFDSSGLYHTVWHDDGNGRSQLFYSVYDGQAWSNPELIVQTKFNIRNPDMAVDGNGRVWVVYEDTSWGQTEISVSVRDDAGWNPPTRITNQRSEKHNPAIIIDAFNNVHLVWEDNRNGTTEIFWAQRRTDRQAWISSGQFGEEMSVMSQNDNNSVYVNGTVSFKHPRLTYLHPYVWLVAEGLEENEHKSAIYLGFRDVEDNFWSSSGVPRFDNEGNFLANGISTVVSPTDRVCVNPDIASNDSLSNIIVVWEDKTEPISQIWGTVYTGLGIETLDAKAITARNFDCKNPSVGFTALNGAIMFESNNEIYLTSYNSNTFDFAGSATGDEDVLIQTGSEKTVSNPVVAQSVPATNFLMVYDYLRTRDGTLSDIEFPDFYLIGDASISLNVPGYPLDLITTSTL